MGNAESENILAAEFGRVPARKSLWTRYTTLDNGLPPKNRKVIVDALDYARTPPKIRDFRAFDSEIGSPQMTRLNKGEINGQQMILEMEPKIAALLK